MTTPGRRLLDEALALPVADRAALAAELLASLDETDADDVSAAWLAEIERRAHVAVAASDDDVAWESVRGELHAEQR